MRPARLGLARSAPRPYALLGMALLLTGVAVVVLGGGRAARRAAPTALPTDPIPLDGYGRHRYAAK